MSPATGGEAAPPPPRLRFNLAVTGHRLANPALAAHEPEIRAAIDRILGWVAAAVAEGTRLPTTVEPPRLHCLLSDGVDQWAAESGLALGFELVAPTPFGARLHHALIAEPATHADAARLLAGETPTDPAVAARAAAHAALLARARLFALAEQDAQMAAHFLASLEAPPGDPARIQFDLERSARNALAARVMIEQSDLLIAIWDGEPATHLGGTGHSIAVALDQGASVLWIDVANPGCLRLLGAPEALADPAGLALEAGAESVTALVRAVLDPAGCSGEFAGFAAESWPGRSNPLWHGYRRVETLFSGQRRFRRLVETYEAPSAVASGSGAPLLAAAEALPGGDPKLVARLAPEVLERFAFADGVSAYLSDCYRGGMTANFVLSAVAVVAGLAYQPLATTAHKWMFALVEFALLSTIILITFTGTRLRWHGRWFETRRVAEYLRHAPSLLLLGVARAPGRWPRGADTAWPECYARAALRELGLPHMAVSAAYLRALLTGLIDPHVVRQRDYHLGKAAKLTAVHNNLDRLSGLLFQAAVVAVSVYLLASLAAFAGLIPLARVHGSAKIFTFLGVMLPTFGAALAGIRYFGDFERFAAISEVTAEKLDAIHGRIQLLARAPDGAIDYGRVAELAHAADDIVVAEIENWQAVFGGKHITVPV